MEATDLIPQTRAVKCGGTDLTVHPLTLAQIFQMLVRFKGLGASMMGGGDVATAIMAEGDAAVIAAVACALRRSEQDAAAIAQDAITQLRILTACVDLTLPRSDDELGETIAQVVALAERTLGAIGRLSSPV